MQAEVSQDRRTRTTLYERLAEELGRPVIALFTSYTYRGVMLDDDDANMLEGILQDTDLLNGLCLVISSPGGLGTTAERIINMCRAYSGTGEYWAFVPSRAKSAATMVCMGASKIIMGPSSELGPIDPQWGPSQNGVIFSLATLLETYDDLFKRAISTDKNIQPFLQQLDRFDEREIAEFREAVQLSYDIASRALATGMMNGEKEADIKRQIDVFCTPKRTHTHGRPIFRDEAGKCGLVVEAADIKSASWKDAYELQIRLDTLVSTRASKVIEHLEDTFMAGVPLSDAEV
jgi:ClpP class serine protease